MTIKLHLDNVHPEVGYVVVASDDRTSIAWCRMPTLVSFAGAPFRRLLLGVVFQLCLIIPITANRGQAADAELNNPSGEVEFEVLNGRDQNPQGKPNFPWVRPNDTNVTPNPTCADSCPAGMMCPGIDSNEGGEDAWDTCIGGQPSSRIVTYATGEKLAEVFYDGLGAAVRIRVYDADKINDGNASTTGTIAWALAQVAAGGVVEVEAGTYEIATTLSMSTSGVTLRCANPATTVLKLDAAADTAILQIGGGANKAQGVSVLGCGFDGNSTANTTTSNLIEVSDSADARIEDNFLRYWRTRGVRIAGSADETGLVENIIRNNYFFGSVDSAGPAIFLDGSLTNDPTDTRIEGNDIGGGPATSTASPVISVTAGAGLQLKHNHIYGGAGNGHSNCVEINDAAFGEIQIIANEIENCREHGLVVTSGAHGVISDNDLYRIGEAGTNPTFYDGIVLTADSYVVTGNTIRGGGTPDALIDDGIVLNGSNHVVFGNKFTPTAGHETGYAVNHVTGGTSMLVGNVNTLSSSTNALHVNAKTTDTVIRQPDASEVIRDPTSGKQLAVVYADAGGTPRVIQVFPETTDKPDEAALDSACTDVDTPHACCTGNGTGTCEGTVAWAESQLTAGGLLAVAPGVYNVSGPNPIVMNTSGTTLHCGAAGRTNNGAIFKLAGAATAEEIIRLGHVTDTQVTNLHVIGCGFDLVSGTRINGTAVWAQNVARSSIRDNAIAFFDTAGIRISGQAAGLTQFITVANNAIHDGTGPAISLETTGATTPTNITIEGNEVATGAATAVSPLVSIAGGATGLRFLGNRVTASGTGNVDCVSVNDSAATDVLIANNTVSSCRQNGINIAALTSGAVQGNLINLASRQTDDFYDGIAIAANQLTVSDNTCRGSSSAGAGIMNDCIGASATNNSLITNNRYHAGTVSAGYAVRIATGGTNTLIGNQNTSATTHVSAQATDLVAGPDGTGYKIASGGTTTIADPLTVGGALTCTTPPCIDISATTNLSAALPLVLTGDEISCATCVTTTTDDDIPEAADYSNLTGGTGITNSPTGTVNATLGTDIATGEIVDDAVTYAKLQNVTDNRLLGRAAGSLGDTTELTVSSPLTIGTGAIGCQTASGAQAGCLSAANWTTFNNKASFPVADTNMNAEDFGSFTCSGGADGCLLDTGSVNSANIANATIAGEDFAATVVLPNGTAFGCPNGSCAIQLPVTSSNPSETGTIVIDSTLPGALQWYDGANLLTGLNNKGTLQELWDGGKSDTTTFTGTGNSILFGFNDTSTLTLGAHVLGVFGVGGTWVYNPTSATAPIISAFSANATLGFGATAASDILPMHRIFSDTSIAALNTTSETTLFSHISYLSSPTFQRSGGSAGAVVSTVNNFEAGGSVASDVTVTTRTGVNITNMGASGTGALTNQVGLDIAALTRGSAVNVGLRNASSTVFTPTTQAIAAAGDDIACTTTYKKFTTVTGDTTLSDNPIIADGQAGQICILQNVDATSTDCLIFTDGQGVQNSAGATLSLCPLAKSPEALHVHIIAYIYDGTDWIEMYRVLN